jgi:hypothetical protein
MLSSKISQPVKTRSFNCAKGTKSLIFGERPSVRLPSLTVPICVSEPIGFAMPLRTASTPATKVVATAPIPGIMMPSFPFEGSMSPAPDFFLSLIYLVRPCWVSQTLKFEPPDKLLQTAARWKAQNWRRNASSSK